MCGKCDKNTELTKQCNQCDKIKSLYLFGSDSENTDKHRGKCNEWRKSSQKAHYEKKKNLPKEFAELKECLECKIIKCRHEFGIDNSRTTGLMDRCTECMNPFVFELIVPENNFLRECDDCKEIKLFSEFSKACNVISGIRNICRICDNNRVIASRENIKKLEKVYVEFKYCTWCKEEHHRSQFNSASYIKTGLKSACKIYDEKAKFEPKEYVYFKKCSGPCETIKHRDEFSKNSYSKDCLDYICKFCTKEYNAQPHVRARALANAQIYRANNKSKI